MDLLLRRRAMMMRKSEDWSKKYLTFEALETGTFKFTTSTIQYSLDGGLTWTNLPANTDTPTIPAGSHISWRASGITASSSGLGTFSSTGQFSVSGNIMSLYAGAGFAQAREITQQYFFRGTFRAATKLLDARHLALPATTLSAGCYQSMFQGCTALTTAPTLPATALANYCYSYMFSGCTSLTTAPMLPATALANNCYQSMFSGCTALTTAPTLPATALANNCYQSMFQGCTALTTAPTLPATALVTQCYYQMFYNCPSLSSVTCYAESGINNSTVGYWLSYAPTAGTFYKAASATWPPGQSGIPTGWQVIDIT